MEETGARDRNIGIRSAIVDSVAFAFIIFVALPLEPVTVALLGLFTVAFFTQRGDRGRSLLIFAGALVALIIVNLANSLLRKETAYYFSCPQISIGCIYTSSHNMFGESVQIVPVLSPFRYEFEKLVQSSRSNSFFLTKTGSSGVSFFPAPLEDLLFSGQKTLVGYNYVDIDLLSTEASMSSITGDIRVGPRRSSIIFAKANSSLTPGLFAVPIDTENPAESARRAAFSNQLITKFAAGETADLSAELWREARATNQAEDYARYAIFALEEADGHASVDLSNYAFQHFIQDVGELIQAGSGHSLNENWQTSYMLNLPRSVCRHLSAERWITGVEDRQPWYPSFKDCSVQAAAANSSIASQLVQSIRTGAGAFSQFPENYNDKLWSVMAFSLGTQGARDFKTDQKLIQSLVKVEGDAAPAAIASLPHATRLKLAWNLLHMIETSTWDRYALLAEASPESANSASSCLSRSMFMQDGIFALPKQGVGGPEFERALGFLLPNTERMIFKRREASAYASADKFYDLAGKSGIICMAEIIKDPGKDAIIRAFFGGHFNSLIWPEIRESRQKRKLTLQFLVSEMVPMDRNFFREEYRTNLFWLLHRMAGEYQGEGGSTDFVQSAPWTNACAYVDLVTESYTNSQETAGQLAPHFKRSLENALFLMNKLCGRAEGDQLRMTLEARGRNWIWVTVDPKNWPGGAGLGSSLPAGNETGIEGNVSAE